MRSKIVLSVAVMIGLAGCSTGMGRVAQKALDTVSQSTQVSLRSIQLSEARDSSRDVYRKPVETLEFFGLEKDMTVLEVLPGSGYYTDFLAEYLRIDGEYIAAHYPVNSDGPEYRSKSRIAFNKKIKDNSDLFGWGVNVVDFDMEREAGLVPDGSVDMVLTFRNLHGFERNQKLDEAFSKFHAVLKDGGKLGVVQHKSKLDEGDIDSSLGYLSESYVIQKAVEAGFTLIRKSSMHHNEMDTTVHGDVGVWALPPTLRGDKTKQELYRAIGESNRMTLLFEK